MKRFVFTISILLIAVVAMAQSGKVRTFTVDTVKGAETVNFDFKVTKGNVSIVWFLKATEIGGTTNEVGQLKFSVDGTTYQTYENASQTDFVSLFASDTSKIANNGNEWTATDGESWGGVLTGAPYTYWRIAMIGESSDTTSYSGGWSYK